MFISLSLDIYIYIHISLSLYIYIYMYRYIFTRQASVRPRRVPLRVCLRTFAEPSSGAHAPWLARFLTASPSLKPSVGFQRPKVLWNGDH